MWQISNTDLLRLNAAIADVLNCVAFNCSEVFVITLAFNRMITYVSESATIFLFGGKRVYVSGSIEEQCHYIFSFST